MYASILKGNKKDQFREAIVRKITVFFVKSLHKQGEGGAPFYRQKFVSSVRSSSGYHGLIEICSATHFFRFFKFFRF